MLVQLSSAVRSASRRTRSNSRSSAQNAVCTCSRTYSRMLSVYQPRTSVRMLARCSAAMLSASPASPIASSICAADSVSTWLGCASTAPDTPAQARSASGLRAAMARSCFGGRLCEER